MVRQPLDFPRAGPDVLFDETIPDILEAYAQASLELVRLSRATDSTGPIVFSIMRDERAIIGDFLRHYRGAGIDKFVILDNNSTDDTFAYLCQQDDVDLYRTRTGFTTIRKQAWLNILLDSYRAPGQWYICVDADEHIVFDGLERGRDFRQLANVMERQGIWRCRGCLVDMYSHHPIAQSRFGTEDALVDAYPLFDGSGYSEYSLPELIAREGGPRHKLFEGVAGGIRPQLTKYPLFRLDRGDFFVNPHFLWPYDRNFDSECFLGLLHFKFLPDFSVKTDRAVEEENYWRNSLEYQIYKSTLLKQQDLTFLGENTEFYQGPLSLVQGNVIARISW